MEFESGLALQLGKNHILRRLSYDIIAFFIQFYFRFSYSISFFDFENPPPAWNVVKFSDDAFFTKKKLLGQKLLKKWCLT